MAQAKTVPTGASVPEFIKSITDPQRRADAARLVSIFHDLTSEEALMWGDSIVGFGRYYQRYASGREAEWPAAGFSPRKNALTIYIVPGFEMYSDILAKLGRFTISKFCLYVKTLSDVDEAVLGELVGRSLDRLRAGDLPGAAIGPLKAAPQNPHRSR